MKNVVLFSSARSGGNLLDGLIRKYQNVKVLGEMYNRRPHHYFNKIDNILKKYGRYTLSNEKLFRLIEDEYKDEYDILLSRFHYTHFRFRYNENVFDLFDNFGKILLYRENFINKLVSFNIVVKDTKKWHYSKQDILPDYKKYTIFFGKKYVENQLNRLKRNYNRIIDRFGSENIEFVKYEDLLENNDISYLANKFGFLNYNSKIEIPTMHINTKDNNYEYVINYDELKDLKLILKKTKHGYRF